MVLLHRADPSQHDLLQDGITDAVTATTGGQVVRLVESLDGPDLADAAA